MKKELIEELRRMYEIAYNGQIVNEGIVDKLVNNIQNKADLVSPQLNDFYKTLEDAASTGGLSQQKYGQTNYKKGVEALQIALSLLGYKFPKFGIDGRFGSETANNVNRFNSTINESVESLRDTLSSLGHHEKGNELTSGGQISDGITNIVAKILTEFKQADPNTSVTVTAGNDKFHVIKRRKSAHTKGNAIDVTLNPYNSNSAKLLKGILERYKSKSPGFSYIDEYTNPGVGSTGGHFHLQYDGGSIPNQPARPNGQQNLNPAMVVASPQTINKIIEALRNKGITPRQIAMYLDPVTNTNVQSGQPTQKPETGQIRPTNGVITELDLSTNEGVTKYAKICDQFLSSYTNLLGITGSMLASGARSAFSRYGKYVPPELALSQLLIEGGINNSNPKSRPIRTKNPFNVGNTDSGKNRVFVSLQRAINQYYFLIASNYIGDKSATDLFKNFTNSQGKRYAQDPDYENKLGSIAQKVNKIGQGIIS